jgi:hypothetical protein
MKRNWPVLVFVVAFTVAGCAGASSEGEDRMNLTTSREPTLVSEPPVEECSPGAACAPERNPHAIPNVVGMKVEAACRTLLRKDYLAYVWGKRHSEEFEPGRVVAQKPKAGSKPGVPHGVFLFVSKPVPDMLQSNTHCAERKVGPID